MAALRPKGAEQRWGLTAFGDETKEPFPEILCGPKAISWKLTQHLRPLHIKAASQMLEGEVGSPGLD